MRNCVVVFDSNIYRTLVFGLNSIELKNKINTIKNLEKRKNISAFLLPVVLLELLSHLSDVSDPSYDTCKNAILLMIEHCDATTNKYPNIIGDFDVHLCNLLFGEKPKHLIEYQNKFIFLALTIYDNSTEDNLNKYRSSFTNCKSLVNNLKENFVKGIKDLKDEFIEKEKSYEKIKKRFNNDLKNNIINKKVAVAQINRAYSYFNIDFSKSNDREEVINKVINEFKVVFTFYCNYLMKIINSFYEYNLDKKEEGNNYFDFNILYAVGKNLEGKKVYFVSNDKDLLNASKKTGFSQYVLNLEEYLVLIDYNCDNLI